MTICQGRETLHEHEERIGKIPSCIWEHLGSLKKSQREEMMTRILLAIWHKQQKTEKEMYSLADSGTDTKREYTVELILKVTVTAAFNNTFPKANKHCSLVINHLHLPDKPRDDTKKAETKEWWSVSEYTRTHLKPKMRVSFFWKASHELFHFWYRAHFLMMCFVRNFNIHRRGEEFKPLL